MYKQITFVLAATALLASCSVKEDRINCSAPVYVSVNDFSMQMEEFPTTKSDPVSDYTAAKYLTLAFYRSDGTEAYKQTQSRDDAGSYESFGEFSCDLVMGSYTMVVIAYAGESSFTLNSPVSAVCTDDRLQDTFAATQTVQVHDTAPLELSATLHRVVSRLGVRSSDVKPANATKLRMTFTKGDRDFSPSTGFALTNTGFVNTIDFGANSASTISVASFLFLAADEDSQNVTLEVLDNDGKVLRSASAQDVPLKRNRLTVLKGSLFSSSASSSFLIDSDWLDSEEISF